MHCLILTNSLREYLHKDFIEILEEIHKNMALKISGLQITKR